MKKYLNYVDRALQPPGWKKSWIIGVRVVSTKKLVAFISAIPATLHIHDKWVRFLTWKNDILVRYL